jgi:peroxiredoxin
LAEFRDGEPRYRAAGFDIAALSVDEPATSESIRRSQRLTFPLLCDPTAGIVVKPWNLFNPSEAGGIARPAIFAIASGRRIVYQSLDAVASRIRATDLLPHLQSTNLTPEPHARVIIPRPAEILRTLLPALKAIIAPARRRK